MRPEVESVDQAVDRWLDDLDSELAACSAVRRRLVAEPEGDSSGLARKQAYASAAGRLLDQGQGKVAASLLERGVAHPTPSQSRSPSGRARFLRDLDVLMQGLVGRAGLPALTEMELGELRAAVTPDEALEVLRGAQARLRAHGKEARRLLMRRLEREGT